MQYTLESVQNVLQSFYSPQQQDNNTITLAQEWLIQFQKSPYVWTIGQQLLALNIVEYQYFGASSIEGKLKGEWNTLGNEMQTQLLGNLLRILGSESGLNKTVITRLCLAVSVIANHSTPDLWAHPIQDILKLANLIDPNTNQLSVSAIKYDTLNIVFELLTIFPDELLNCDYITQDRRKKVGMEYNKQIETVIQLVSYVMSSFSSSSSSNGSTGINKTNILRNALKCLKSWIYFDIPTTSFLTGPLIHQYCFDAIVKDPHLVEDFVLLLDEIGSFMGGKHFKKYPTTFNPIVSRMLDILPHYAFLAKQEENEKIFNAIYLLFIHYAESHIKLVMELPSLDRYLQAIIELSVKGDMEVVDFVSPFVIEIHSIFDQSVEVSKFYPFLDNLIDVFCIKCMYPEEVLHTDQLDQQDMDNFYSYRTIAGDSILSIHSVMEERTKTHLLKLLWNEINTRQQQKDNSSNDWRSIESIVFLLGCISEGVGNDDGSFIPQLFQLLGSLQIRSTPLIKSTIVLAGKYASILDNSAQFLMKIVGDLIPPLSNPELAPSAAHSFLSITQNKKCAKLLAPNISNLLTVCDLNSKQPDTVNKILEGLFEIINVLPTNDVMNYITPLVSPFINMLNNSQSYDHPTLLNSIKLLTKFVKIFEPPEFEEDSDQELSPINSNNNSLNNSPQNSHILSQQQSSQPQQQQQQQPSPILPIVQVILPLTGNLLSRFTNDLEMVENISMLYKRICLTCSTSIELILPTICYQMTNCFNSSPTPSPLTLSTLCVGIAPLPNNTKNDYVTQSITTISNAVVQIWKVGNQERDIKQQQQQQQHLQNNSINNNNQNGSISPILYSINHHQNNNNNISTTFTLSIQPDITKEYFTFIQQCIKYNVLSVPPNTITLLFQIILDNILNIQDKNTARPVFSYLSYIISIQKREALPIYQNVKLELDQLLQKHGESLLRQLLVACGGSVPRSISPYIAEVIHSFVSFYPGTFRPLAIKMFEQEGFPSIHISVAQKKKYLELIMRSKTKRQMRNTIKDFCLVCLGMNESQPV